MSDAGELTMGYLLGYVRQQLIEAREEKNEKRLIELGNIFDLLEGASLEAKDRSLAALAEAMRCAVRDSLMGTEWKSRIPSLDEISGASEQSL